MAVLEELVAAVFWLLPRQPISKVEDDHQLAQAAAFRHGQITVTVTARFVLQP